MLAWTHTTNMEACQHVPAIHSCRGVMHCWFDMWNCYLDNAMYTTHDSKGNQDAAAHQSVFRSMSKFLSDLHGWDRIARTGFMTPMLSTLVHDSE